MNKPRTRIEVRTRNSTATEYLPRAKALREGRKGALALGPNLGSIVVRAASGAVLAAWGYDIDRARVVRIVAD